MRLIDADLIQYEPMLSAQGNGMYETVMVAYKSQIDDLPTIEERKKVSDEEWTKTRGGWTNQPERKTGRWERHNTYYGDDVSGSVDPDWRCSECGGQANVNIWYMYDLTDFCPHCGADMRGE